MTLLSTRAKEAIKTGLAMAIAYWIALQMNWENPYWAGFAVATVSLATAGQSLNKGAMRMAGTVVAAVMALTLLAMFLQERWWLITSLSLFVGFCVYMMTGHRYRYFWFVTAFVCLIICVSASASSAQTFQIAVERTQETAMGILVYTLISTFLWPRGTAAELNEVSRKLFLTLGQSFPAYRGLMARQVSEADFRPLQLQAIQLCGQLGPKLEAAESDTYVVFELRHKWRRFRDQSSALLESLGRWRESAPEIKHLDVARLLPNLDDLCLELEQRLIQIERMLAGKPPERTPKTLSLRVDKPGLRPYAQFEKAAVAVTKAELDRLESLTRSLFERVQDIKGYGKQSAYGGQASPKEATPRGFIILVSHKFFHQKILTA